MVVMTSFDRWINNVCRQSTVIGSASQLASIGGGAGSVRIFEQSHFGIRHAPQLPIIKRAHNPDFLLDQYKNTIITYLCDTHIRASVIAVLRVEPRTADQPPTAQQNSFISNQGITDTIITEIRHESTVWRQQCCQPRVQRRAVRVRRTVLHCVSDPDRRGGSRERLVVSGLATVFDKIEIRALDWLSLTLVYRP